MIKKRPDTSVFSIICIDGFCAIDIKYELSKNETDRYYNLDGTLFHEEPNPLYDPDAKMEEPPDWCPGEPSFVCLANRCKYFLYSELDREDDL